MPDLDHGIPDRRGIWPDRLHRACLLRDRSTFVVGLRPALWFKPQSEGRQSRTYKRISQLGQPTLVLIFTDAERPASFGTPHTSCKTIYETLSSQEWPNAPALTACHGNTGAFPLSVAAGYGSSRDEVAELDMRFVIAFFLSATSAVAQTPMTAAEFDAYVTGKILTFGSPGNPNYGVEHYLPNRRVLWSAFNGECLEGRWYEEDQNICFAYEDTEEHHCWTVFRTPTGIEATNADSGQIIFEANEDPSALVCGNFFS